jgi:hypothetical protein
VHHPANSRAHAQSVADRRLPVQSPIRTHKVGISTLVRGVAEDRADRVRMTRDTIRIIEILRYPLEWASDSKSRPARERVSGLFRLAAGTDSTSSVPLLPVRNALLLFVE